MHRARFPSSLIGLLLLTLVVRVGVLLLVPGALAGDPDEYRHLAENLVAHGTFGTGTQPTAYRPPLYPLMLAPCVALPGVAATVAIGLLHVLLGLGTVWLAWCLALRCGLGRLAWLAGALVACDPILLGQSALVMSETAAAFLVALALLCLVRAVGGTAGLPSSGDTARESDPALLDEPAVAPGMVERPSIMRCASAGAVLGMCGLCRPELLLWAVACVPALFILWGVMAPRDAQKPSRARQEAVSLCCPPDRFLTGAARFSAMVVGVLIVLLPWAVCNQIQFGRPIVTTTHGGYTLLLANNPSFYEYLREGERGTVWDARGLGPVWGGEARYDSPADELAADARARTEAWENIRRQPGMFAYACLVRVGRFWALAPHRGTPWLRLAIGVWYLAEFALAAVGLWIGLRRGPLECNGLWVWGLLLAVSMTAIHAVYWSNMRMRGPLVAVVALGAAVGVARWVERARQAQVASK